MSVNGVTNNYGATQSTYSASQSNKAKNSESAKATDNAAQNNTGVVYEPSNEAPAVKTPVRPNPEMVAQLKSDLANRKAQLLDLVHKTLNGQTNAFGKANENSIWDTLRTGNFTVDEDTRLQAQADIAEDGYWGVSQTSQRILDFATALVGDDPEKLEEMRSAFEKGYKMAEKTWGGKLPDISKQTFDAVMAGFDKLKEGNTAEDGTPIE
ncbi:MAG: hypothetical protein LBV33_01590 [Lachnospiraceae bacterium]|jgi:hypothetical protein|nr:hypothetical protein [Lachnospiraceae bacterium]